MMMSLVRPYLRYKTATFIASKYADDIDLLVPQYCDIDLATEFDNIQ